MVLTMLRVVTVLRLALLSGLLCAIGCGSSGGAKPRDASTDAAGAGPVDCAAVCEHVRTLCAGESDIDDLWVSTCESQCQARMQLEPNVASLEKACVDAAATCDTAVSCAATPTAPPKDGGVNRQDASLNGQDGGGADAGRDAGTGTTDAGKRNDAGVGPSVVRATVDGTPIVFDDVTNVQFIADVILIEAWTSDQSHYINTYTASGTGFLPSFPATYGCTNTDIGYLHYAVYPVGGPDAGAGQTYGNTSSGSSPCSVIYTRADSLRIQGTFSATSYGAGGSVKITNGSIDVIP